MIWINWEPRAPNENRSSRRRAAAAEGRLIGARRAVKRNLRPPNVPRLAPGAEPRYS